MLITETGFFTATSGSRLAAAEGVGKRGKKDAVRPFCKCVTKTRSAARRACRTEAARLCFRKGNEKSHPYRPPHPLSLRDIPLSVPRGGIRAAPYVTEIDAGHKTPDAKRLLGLFHAIPTV